MCDKCWSTGAVIECGQVRVIYIQLTVVQQPHRHSSKYARDMHIDADTDARS